MDRPALLTRITIPAGGWQIRLKVSGAVTLDTTVTATMAAGDYYVAWDGQATDFLWELCRKVNVAIDAAGLPGWIGRAQGMMAWLNSTHQVKLGFDGEYFQGNPKRDVRIEWTALNGVSIGDVLGFDTTADDTITGTDNPIFTSDWHHAYGWYADEDGSLRQYEIENQQQATSPQTITPAGYVKTQHLGTRQTNLLKLVFLPRKKTWSGNVAYKSASVTPYERNEPLQCWWLEARKGTPFRVLRNARIDLASAQDRNLAGPTASSATTMTDSGKSWDVDPQQWKARLLVVDGWAQFLSGEQQRFYIASHTATVITAAQQQEPQLGVGGFSVAASDYYIFDQRYDTFVLDMGAMQGFAPTEVPKIDRFDIEIPVLRLES